MPPSRKRARVDCEDGGCDAEDCISCDPGYAPLSAPPTAQFSEDGSSPNDMWEMIMTLDPQAMRILLFEASAFKKAEEEKFVGFQDYIDEASEIWNTLDSTSGSDGYENDFEAASNFRKLAVKIEDRVSEHSSYDTKWSALDALTLVSLQIVDGPWGGVGSGVRKYWEQDTRLSQAMRHVHDAMTEEEIKLLRDDEEYIENLEALQENAEERGLKMGFDLIFKSLIKKQKGAELAPV
ncbi:hypothetical protein LTR56_008211 [Elasticomyces elasticus]|nr:hypothetical protein LTR56_008211 [Elasticomyces elasticus]KAK3661776.1 hypothetical protein LTR22_007357 [Elasticomyces elasticus]KAK4924381.1 hypothetical protein LTR49_008470 [Elasticomyces elasticus]